MKKIILIYIVILLLSSCELFKYTPDNTVELPLVFIESSNLFKEIPLNSNEYKFETNEVNHNGPFGKTFWSILPNTNGTFTELTTVLTKTKGREEGGYGVVFCQDKSGVPAIDTMLVLIIKVNSHYMIGKVIGDRFIKFTDGWIRSDHLVSGYSVPNKVHISFDSLQSEFSVSFNDFEVEATFTDNNEPIHRSGSLGFIAVISPADEFPEHPVSIIYKKL